MAPNFLYVKSKSFYPFLLQMEKKDYLNMKNLVYKDHR